MSPMKTDAEGAAESAWTTGELAEVRATLEADVARLRRELADVETEIGDQMRASSGDTGDEVADVGTFLSDVGAETTLANNSLKILLQSERALARIVGSGYGMCESCAGTISKPRLQAFPRATLCLECQEHRSRG